MQENIGPQVDSGVEKCLSLTLHSLISGTCWALCGQTADYAAASFIEIALPEAFGVEQARRREIEGTVRHTLSELLENALKFRSGGAIELDLSRGHRSLVCAVRNQVMSEQAPTLRDHLAGLLGSSPQGLLRHTVEARTSRSVQAGAGIGLLMLMSDHGVRLGWQLEPTDSGTHVLTTQARIQI